MRKVTIEDISRFTELSRGTVSRALNDRPDISKKTKKRVIEACRALNYVPSHAARSLATGRYFAVAAIIRDLHVALNADILTGITTRASESNNVVYAYPVGRDASKIAAIIQSLPLDRIDGIIVAADIDAPSARALADMAKEKTVSACMRTVGLSCDVFRPDRVEAGRLAGRALAPNEPRKVVYLERSAPEHAEAEALLGLREALAATTVTIEALAVNPLSEDFVDSLRGPLADADAVVAADDWLALALSSVADRIDRKPGVDFDLIGQGNERFGTCVKPALATIDFLGIEIGERTMDAFLQRRAEQRGGAPQTVDVCAKLIRCPSLRSGGSQR